MFKAVIFDIDGTLVDSVDLHAEAWEEAFRRFGFSIPAEKIRGKIGKGGDQLLPDFLDQRLIARFGSEIQAFRTDLFARKYMDRVHPFPGVRDLFSALRARGFRLVLASSGKEDEVKRYQEIAGITDLVDSATSSDDAEHSKPAPDIFQAALARNGLQPDEAVVIGDSPYDAEAATRAGIQAMGVLCGGFPEEDLRAAGCHWIFQDPAHLLAELDRSPLGTA
ncbi:haloacid dehalogenase superfamily, subfamily IA, variant 3 with third motif having DD or ED/haloacid dehalogenase superfamily, subfamily IA, variant 1 with third motif having Dx(3-4)D or Dx(3-4)E [Faunimonas pinastri]|uniref:Haloacid dehalogenase superfamily, subfamily IA, variant 3 with third motif having DD or ED/haloacid dehalogenase superfamily, subfamily IA, variant 1 with third motif having Dx(3-4)D or Dx(3-4)E n=1 Tax=Faunimonas pinastri TaxID=1855383 RepID=A0A1H9JEY5_9HYPH|nr:HAD family hydrolase [Faunimonas pinastri]SEQ85353.1 haloacid dehalogenase superfamily, subfamily IA, variant 3 with third motif having DD or ED/haloacid dehalogenase superfamily, subfamily IA, variant 1 with third motif having Dx(3-4)D or Dx(3-4)E [Faunimonas pinastri]